MCEFFHKLWVGNYVFHGEQNKNQRQIQKEMSNWEKHLQLLETGGKMNNIPTEKWLKDMNREHTHTEKCK